MRHKGICHPLAAHFAARGRYQIGTQDPVNGSFIGYSDNLDEAVELLWTHYQRERQHDREAEVAVRDSRTRSLVLVWVGGSESVPPASAAASPSAFDAILAVALQRPGTRFLIPA